MSNDDIQLLQDWWQLVVNWWKNSPIRSTSHILMLLMALWVIVDNLLAWLK